MNAQPKNADMLAQLRANFRGKMLDRLISIENASVRLSEVPTDETALGLIRRECHKLSGVSKSLGFPEIGDMATEIDCAISLDGTPWEVLQPKVEDLLDRMEEELDE